MLYFNITYHYYLYNKFYVQNITVKYTQFNTTELIKISKSQSQRQSFSSVTVISILLENVRFIHCNIRLPHNRAKLSPKGRHELKYQDN